MKIRKLFPSQNAVFTSEMNVFIDEKLKARHTTAVHIKTALSNAKSNFPIACHDPHKK